VKNTVPFFGFRRRRRGVCVSLSRCSTAVRAAFLFNARHPFPATNIKDNSKEYYELMLWTNETNSNQTEMINTNGKQ